MFEEHVQPLVDFVVRHQAWAAPIVFVLAFAESLAFISLLVPAWGALVLIGTIVRAGGLDFWSIWIAASIGAALGDWLSYWIGLKLEHAVQNIWPLSRHPQLIPKGEAFIRKWGMLGIFKPNPEKCEEVSRWQVPSLHYPCWAAPVLSNGKLYLRSEDHLLCIDLAKK